MKRVPVEVMNAFCDAARAAIDPQRVPPMSRDELVRFNARSRERDEDLWARIQSDDRPQQRLALN